MPTAQGLQTSMAAAILMLIAGTARGAESQSGRELDADLSVSAARPHALVADSPQPWLMLHGADRSALLGFEPYQGHPMMRWDARTTIPGDSQTSRRASPTHSHRESSSPGPRYSVARSGSGVTISGSLGFDLGVVFSDPDDEGISDPLGYVFQGVEPSFTVNAGLPVRVPVEATESGPWSEPGRWSFASAFTIAFDLAAEFTGLIAELASPNLGTPFAVADTFEELNSLGPTERSVGLPFEVSLGGLFDGAVDLSFSPSVLFQYDVIVSDGRTITLDQSDVLIESLTVDGNL